MSYGFLKNQATVPGTKNLQTPTYVAPVISFFGHHFRDLHIRTFMVVKILILILIYIIFLNYILLSLASFNLYCG